MATTLKLVTGELVDITAKYPSNYWHTPTYAEMTYIRSSRSKAANLRTLGRIDLGGGNYVNGLFLLPDLWTLPVGITLTITYTDYTINTYSLADFSVIENSGAIFFPACGLRSGLTVAAVNVQGNYCCNGRLQFSNGGISLYNDIFNFTSRGQCVRICRQGSQFSTSATTKIDFAPANLQYHCTQHIWRFAEHSYDIIGTDNANISDSYDGWIDLFGFGTSGVNYSPTLHTTNNADYCQANLNGTVNDWGYNKICVDSNPLDTRTKIYENKIRALEFSNI